MREEEKNKVLQEGVSVVKIIPVHVTIKSSLDEIRRHPYGQKNQMPPVNCSAALERRIQRRRIQVEVSPISKCPRHHDGENEPTD